MRHRVSLTWALALLAVVGCASDHTTGPTPVASVVGVWNLSTVNGAPLPWVQQSGDFKVEFLSDQLIFAADGTFTETAQERFTSGPSVTMQTGTDQGTYTTTGNTVVLRFASSGQSAPATVSGNTLTVTANHSSAYVRQ